MVSADFASTNTATYSIFGATLSCALSSLTCLPRMSNWSRSPKPVTTAITVAKAPAAAAPRHTQSPCHKLPSHDVMPPTLAWPDCRASCIATASRSARTMFWIRVQMAGIGKIGDCSSVMPDRRPCHTNAAARTVAFSREIASKRRRAPPRKVPSA